MKFRTEPTHQHGRATRTAVLLVNLGTPDEPTPEAVRRYLGEFLADPRVVEIPRLAWWFILKLFILPRRGTQSAAKYAKIWTKEGSPLRVHTEKLARMLKGVLGQRAPELTVDFAMRYGSPSIADTLDRLREAGVDRFLVVPLYPQYSATTTASVHDALMAWCAVTRNLPEIRVIKHYHDHPAYITALVGNIARFWAREGRLTWESGSASAPQSGMAHPASRLLLSFHGVPQRTLDLGDPYHCECHKTARLLAEQLGAPAGTVEVSFQSRFGRARWLGPETSATLVRLAREGVTDIDVVCPGFAVDCLETLEEIAIEGRATFLAAGGKNFRYIPCLNEEHAWALALAAISSEHLQGWAAPRASEEELRDQRQRAQALGARD